MFESLFGADSFPRNVRAVDDLKAIAARYDKSLPQLALRWAISHPAVSTALVGCRTVAEVEDNVGAVGWSISDADLAVVRRAGCDDGAIAEVVAHVALNAFTNFFNNVARTDLDFPRPARLRPETAAV